ncbi:MAG: hypothetical protein F6J95_033320 [Leptolyngbya sp. SIO1E4]|nr:hypothetical protein [Leptolyngbya sp. SIO1E4]
MQPGNPRQWRAEVAAELGFDSFSELTEKSGIYPGNMSRISRGINSLTDENAHKLVEAVLNRNYQKGWTYLESAIQVADNFNYLRGYCGYLEGRDIKRIEDTDVERWHCNYLKALEAAHSNVDKQLEIIRFSSDTKVSLENILEFLEEWNMKHDFYYLDRVKKKFKQSTSIVIPKIRRGMEENLYTEIKTIFTEIRHVAHLCEEFEIVEEMSEWLISTHSSSKDSITEIKAKITLAWVLTSNGQRQNLYKAQGLVKQLWPVVTAHGFLNNFPHGDMDAIAILCELRLRLAIRLYEREMRPLTDKKFEKLMFDSRVIVEKIKSFESLEPRLKIRFELPLHYQSGIYFYRKERYEEAINEFNHVAHYANLIGWGRIEQAAYSWLATASYKIGERDSCLEYLKKIDKKHLPKTPKRLCIRDKLYLEIKK